MGRRGDPRLYSAALHFYSQGLFPCAGYRRHPRSLRSSPERLFHRDGRSATGVGARDLARSRDRKSVVLYRRRWHEHDDEQRSHPDQFEAHRGAADQRQRQVSTIFTQLNQYHVVLETQPDFKNDPQNLNNLYVQSNTGGAVPLSTFTHPESANAPLTVNHQGQFPVVTVSFNLAPGASLG